MKLTTNFYLRELEASNKAKQIGIDNSLPAYLLRNAQAIADTLQLVRDEIKQALFISSGYRCESLNAAVGGAYNSQHLLCLAADIYADGYTPEQLAAVVVIKGIEFDQLIIEHAGGKSWLHISVQPKNRHEFLKWDGQKYSVVSK